MIFTPSANFLGAATVGYTITDGVGGTNSSLITVLVTNIPPAANPDSYAITENTTNSFAVLAERHGEHARRQRVAGCVHTTTNGTAAISGTNIVFTPTLNYLGTLTLNYTITDNIGGTNGSSDHRVGHQHSAGGQSR